MFTRLLRPLKHWWSQGLIAIIYLDGIAALNGEAAAMSASIQVRADLAMLGLIEYTYCKVHLDPKCI